MKKTLTIALFGILILNLFSCGQKEKNERLMNTDKNEETPVTLSIDTVSDFPPEISGCSCYFSNDSIEFKKEIYIYMNDFAQTSFLKINGKLTKFIQTEFKEITEIKTISIAKSSDYEITVEINNGTKYGYETSIHSGSIKLTDKKGNTITREFYGLCGC